MSGWLPAPLFRESTLVNVRIRAEVLEHFLPLLFVDHQIDT
jgi:hypothetical protein